jgi:membrane carboxypeptidase/penicillin-binding protein PbpC
VWPAVFRPWAHSAGLLTARPSAMIEIQTSADDSSRPARRRLGFDNHQPLAGALYLYDRRCGRNTVYGLARAWCGGTLEWFVDGTRVGASDRDGSLRWPLVNGDHAVTVRDQSGRQAATRIVVRERATRTIRTVFTRGRVGSSKVRPLHDHAPVPRRSCSPRHPRRP